LRALEFSQHALAAEMEGRDTVVVGRVASLPQRRPDSQRFVFEVESAAEAQRPVDLPGQLQNSVVPAR
jgi:competence protein ComEC